MKRKLFYILSFVIFCSNGYSQSESSKKIFISTVLDDYIVLGFIDYFEIDSISKNDKELNQLVNMWNENDTLEITYENFDKIGAFHKIAMVLLESENCTTVNISSGKTVRKIKKEKFKRKNGKRHYSGGYHYIDKESGNIIIEHVTWIN